MKRLKGVRTNMSAGIITSIVLLLGVFGAVTAALGFVSFTDAFRREYSATTWHMAATAATLVNGDHLDEYLAGEEQEEYERTRQALDEYCRTLHVSMIYVIQVDLSDYGRFVSLFNPVDNSVDDTEYTEWELGHRRDTTNDEYRMKYRKLYKQLSWYETVYRTNPTDGQHPHITTMVPVKDSAGAVVAILCMQRPTRELADARRPYIRRVLLFTLLLALVASVLAVLYTRRQLVQPIRKVSREATRFARENTRGEPLGAISRYEEILNLARSIDTMEADMLGYVENLTRVTAERERIGAELNVAAAIQSNSIPNAFPAFPHREDFDLYASMTPAREVGGDFYNFFLIDDDHLAFVIGDVSGKGVPAALFMMVVNILITEKIQQGGTPGQVLSAVNDAICRRNPLEMFVTLYLGVLEISTGRVIAANAGHDDAAICTGDGGFALHKTRHGLVVGAYEGMKYRDFEFRLEEGEKLFLYTDGVTEATTRDERMYGTERMLAALDRARRESPEGVLARVHEDVDAFVGDAPQFDDMTMLCIERKRGRGRTDP